MSDIYICEHCGSKIPVLTSEDYEIVKSDPIVQNNSERYDNDIRQYVKYDEKTKEMILYYYDLFDLKDVLKKIISEYVSDNIETVKIIRAKKNKLNINDPHEEKIVVDENFDLFTEWFAALIDLNIPLLSARIKYP